MNKKKFDISPNRAIALSFLLMILAGAIILNLPIASRSGENLGFLTSLFTAKVDKVQVGYKNNWAAAHLVKPKMYLS